MSSSTLNMAPPSPISSGTAASGDSPVLSPNTALPPSGFPLVLSEGGNGTLSASTTAEGANNQGTTGPARRKPARRANTAERRATHNAVERARRETLNGRFLDLAAMLPNLANVRRPSKSAIVNSSIAMVNTNRRWRALAARELRTLIAESAQLRSEANAWRAAHPGNPPPGFTAGGGEMGNSTEQISEPARSDMFRTILDEPELSEGEEQRLLEMNDKAMNIEWDNANGEDDGLDYGMMSESRPGTAAGGVVPPNPFGAPSGAGPFESSMMMTPQITNPFAAPSSSSSVMHVSASAPGGGAGAARKRASTMSAGVAAGGHAQPSFDLFPEQAQAQAQAQATAAAVAALQQHFASQNGNVSQHGYHPQVPTQQPQHHAAQHFPNFAAPQQHQQQPQQQSWQPMSMPSNVSALAQLQSQLFMGGSFGSNQPAGHNGTPGFPQTFAPPTFDAIAAAAAAGGAHSPSSPHGHGASDASEANRLAAWNAQLLQAIAQQAQQQQQPQSWAAPQQQQFGPTPPSSSQGTSGAFGFAAPHPLRHDSDESTKRARSNEPRSPSGNATPPTSHQPHATSGGGGPSGLSLSLAGLPSLAQQQQHQPHQGPLSAVTPGNGMPSSLPSGLVSPLAGLSVHTPITGPDFFPYGSAPSAWAGAGAAAGGEHMKTGLENLGGAGGSPASHGSPTHVSSGSPAPQHVPGSNNNSNNVNATTGVSTNTGGSGGGGGGGGGFHNHYAMMSMFI